MPGNKMGYDEYHKACGGKDMSYENYMKAAEAAGRGFLDSDEYEKAGIAFSNMNKADVAASDLLKAIGDYESTASALGEAGGSRQSYLTQRLSDGTITKSEQTELGRILSGDGDTSAPSGEPLRKSFGDQLRDADPNATELVDVSPFLKSLVTQTDVAITQLGNNIEREGMATRNLLAAQGTLLKSTAGALSQTLTLVKSQQAIIDEMGRRLGMVEQQPLVRKSHGVDPRDTRQRNPGKPPPRGGEGSQQLTKSQVQQAYRELIQKADALGDTAAIERLVHASALLESANQIQPNMMAAVQAHIEGH